MKNIDALEALRRYHSMLRQRINGDIAASRLINELEVIYQEFYVSLPGSNKKAIEDHSTMA